MEEAIGEKKERDGDGDGGYTADEGVCMWGGGGNLLLLDFHRKMCACVCR